jgi:phenylpropionate dioxygenase-like ring-hydroxylating dioxygenase large terminal subunit
MPVDLRPSEAALETAARIVADSEGCDGPVAEARVLPGDAYTDANFFEFEKRAIFDQEWLCVAHEREIPNPGDQLNLMILGEPVVILRDTSGEIRSLSGVCQHRGHPLFGGVSEENSFGKPCLNAERLVCPYHNWTYDLDGALVSAPFMTKTTPVAKLRETVRLPEIAVSVFHGLVFINLSGGEDTVATSLKAFGEEVANYGLTELVALPGTVRTDLPWNWKLHHENAMEPYHTAFVHRGIHEEAPPRLAQFCDFADDASAVMHPTYLVSEDVGLAVGAGDDGLLSPRIETLTQEQRSRIMFASLMPTLFIILQPTFVSLSFVLPQTAGTMTLRRVDLYPKAAVEQEGFYEAYAAQVGARSQAIDQDTATTSALQEAFSSRWFGRGPLSYLEQPIVQLNTWLLRRYRAGLA